MENKELLGIYREQINTLDKELIYLLFRRFEIVKQIGIIKKQDGIPPLDNTRWNKLLNENLEVSREYGLRDELIIDIWNRIHTESLKIEK
ncbi:MAG: chorismate mutase [Candidatus Gracilibacteria bacterium]|nr:chorismate mutase [Candidatus Gracilibacteria bacterium]